MYSMARACMAKLYGARVCMARACVWRARVHGMHACMARMARMARVLLRRKSKPRTSAEFHLAGAGHVFGAFTP